MIEITPNLNISKSEPLYIQLYTYIKEEIQQGRINAGVKLPSKRKLSVHLEISQQTVETAYLQLLSEGYIESKPRKGRYVAKLEEYPLSSADKFVTGPSITENRGEEYEVDFSHGKIALDQFPYFTWRKLSAQSLFEDEGSLFNNGDVQGELNLRIEIVNYLYQSRGVRCTPQQVVLGAGTQYLISFITMLIGRHCIYSIEDPGFHRTREAFIHQGVTLKYIPLDQDGLIVKKLIESRASVTYVTPSHQFPTGMVMPIARRLELLKWATETNGYIIEDDYDGEFRYKGKPIPALQGLDILNRVIYLGTFSKSLIPSIRVSFAVLPQELLEEYKRHFSTYKQTVSRLHQHTLFQFMKNGHWETHLNRMRTLYRRRQKVLLKSIETNFSDQVKIIGDHAGLHILVAVKNGMSESELLETAKTHKVKVYPTSIYYKNSSPNNFPRILLGFGGVTEEEIEKGIMRLKKAWS
ncbi:GntR family transcriptional regulator/MocR family aminotransferase [Bacillus mesophilus]|uniref:PLP-dependent aminotransferase family protein n=1 Tax=Bacillus mesophilus TaxID=1808955 RepID=A0A6M0QBH1_9BACI|nr:PLP-dependent aminotransferase family protein [Bacillus mesophilus]MBM7662994.1 GntR family transcriptional regulator/MocR family aminotransferase [Bacillus mesophilus]NEY73682.1 PLP-dependent aminotransferase family protein [Bacillus mesophilus]